MKLIYTLTITFFLSINLFSQAPGWQWAVGAGGVGTDESGNSIATDASGNIYSTGSFGCGTLTIGTASVTRFGSGNAYVVKQDAAGNVQWLKNFGGASSFWGGGTGKGICTDASGNIYVTGFYLSTLVAGSTTLTATDSSGSNVGDIFIIKMDPSGNVIWAKSAGGAYGDGANAISVDANNNVFITGYFKSRYLRFGSSLTVFSSNNSSSSSFIWTDFFVAKYDSNGNPVWASGAGTASLDDSKGIAIDATGNVLIAGNFYLGTMTIGTTTLSGTSATNMFIAKYDNSGNVIWSKTATGAGSGSINHTATGITADASNNVYITGANGASTLTIGSVVLANSNGGYVAKLDASGNCQWANSMIGNAYGTGITNNAGNVFVTGYFSGMTCSFGTVTVANTNTGGNNEDIFVSKYNSSGTLDWATGAGGIYRDIPNGISVDMSGNANVTGYTLNSALSFGTLSVTCTGNYNDIFIAKMGTASGVEELNNDNDQVQIYPNPGTGIFSLKTETSISKIEIINLVGELIYSSTDTEMINISDKPKGIYFIRAEDKNKKILSGKIVLQ